MIERYPLNAAGRDFAVGDIHGCFTRLKIALHAAGFDPAVDRLFSVGDLVDRGPESERAIEWLDKPWFFAVRGNHEDMLISAQVDLHFSNGGAWFYGLAERERADIIDRLSELPLLIEVEVPKGLVGLIHADVPGSDWGALKARLNAGRRDTEHLVAACLWSRTRIMSGDASVVRGIGAVVVGHTAVDQPVMLGNVIHIDTGGWLPKRHGGHFTLLNLHTLETLPPMPRKLQWEGQGA